MAATTAANPTLTEATSRKAAPQATNSSTPQSQDAAQRYSSRQALPYKKQDLHQFPVPNLTIKDLLSAIPPHCFERSAWRSFKYVIGDFTLIALLGLAASYIDPVAKSYDFASSPIASYLSAPLQAAVFKYAAWTAYWILQGMVFTGVWVIAHECGHQGFSTSKTLNNAVGWVLHSLLLVPYHSWRISHARHHAATGHLTRDEVFVPRTRAQKGLLPLQPASSSSSDEDEDSDAELVDNSLGAASPKQAAQPIEVKETWGEWIAETFEDAPLYNLIFITVQQILGWPMYLMFNSSGQLHYPKNTNHFDPQSIIFDARHRNQVLMSDVGLILVLTGLSTWGYLTSFSDVFRYYVIPYFMCNHWLVMITYLQHTDPLVPHYTADAWTFPRGALCTVDRKWLGPVGPYLFHGIAETHVAHHISSKIPHYHAWDATEALKERLGVHYQFSNENVFVSLWKSINTCKFVDENDQVAFYKNANGVPKAVAMPDSGYNSDSGVGMSE